MSRQPGVGSCSPIIPAFKRESLLEPADRFFPKQILDPVQICVGRRMSQNSQHRYDLAFVVKCMGDDVQ